ncbi:MAG: transcriptional regulator NrdR [Verrucomicrobia bacterium]|nr:transcriptional regulator NrdR [Verrucomicrobiota bacterium]
MRCPKCGCRDDKVIDSRASREGATIRRRRECLGCNHRFTTYEQIETRPLVVIKRDGRRELFSREKLLNGITRACEKRPVSPESIEEVVERINAELHSDFDGEVPGTEVGERVMNELRVLDQVAYVRFASVYRRFEEATDFLQAVQKLERPHDTATYRLPGF